MTKLEMLCEEVRSVNIEGNADNIDIVRAVLEAMRAPTEAMLTAMGCHMGIGYAPHSEAEDAWRAGIDAILNEEDKGA